MCSAKNGGLAKSYLVIKRSSKPHQDAGKRKAGWAKSTVSGLGEIWETGFIIFIFQHGEIE